MGRRAEIRPLELSRTGRTLVVSDIHGNLPLLRGVLKKARFSRADTLIVLGDILERHPQSLATLRYLMELARAHTVLGVLGNCDNLVLSFADGGDDLDDGFFQWWLGRLGTRSAIAQMAEALGLPWRDPAHYPALRAALRTHFAPELDFLRKMPHILVNEDYLLVHGGVPREDRLDTLDAFGCMKNDDFLNQGHTFRRWVVVGHWPVTLYRADIPSAAPIVCSERRIVSIDGGCTLKWDGQLNALFLPPAPDGDFTWVSFDGFPAVTALDAQAPSADPLNIRFGHSALELVEEGPEFCRCRHLETGRVLDILTEYLYRGADGLRCEDSTDYLLPVTPGDRLSVVRRTSRGLLAKKDGVTGWYRGRFSE